MSKERPILFSAPMVRAILEGRKTQTRRVVNAKHLPWIENSVLNFLDGIWNQRPLPYGQPGDLLWVRESWRIGAWCVEEGSLYIDYRDGPRKEWIEIEDGDEFEKYWIQCSEELDHKGVKTDADGNYRWEPGSSPLRWRPSIHMPRWASRITLRIKSVRVERLNQISEEDAEREGAKRKSIDDSVYVLCSYKHAFKTLWKSINGPDSWSANPWVWVIEFERVLAQEARS